MPANDRRFTRLAVGKIAQRETLTLCKIRHVKSELHLDLVRQNGPQIVGRVLQHEITIVGMSDLTLTYLSLWRIRAAPAYLIFCDDVS